MLPLPQDMHLPLPPTALQRPQPEAIVSPKQDQCAAAQLLLSGTHYQGSVPLPLLFIVQVLSSAEFSDSCVHLLQASSSVLPHTSYDNNPSSYGRSPVGLFHNTNV